MNATVTLLCLGLGVALAWPLYPLVIRWFQPLAEQRAASFHQIHVRPVPRAGGLVLAAVFLIVGIGAQLFLPVRPDRVAENWGILALSVAMFALGFWDDLRPLGARKKLVGQILIALAACYLVGRIELVRHPVTGEVMALGFWGIPLTVLWLVAFTNLINLIDGLDGLAGGLSLMLMALLAYVGLFTEAVFPTAVAAAVAGGLIAFLRYNFPPARIYLGDGGAYFLGFLIGLLAMRLSHKGTVAAALVAPLFALALPIIDTSLAILRRGLKGLPLFRPDRKHIHHKLLGEGLNQRQTVLVLYGFSLVALMLAFGVFVAGERTTPLFLGVLVLVVLLAATRLNFAREWFAVGRLLGSTMEVRKAARYALALCNWFELEAERCRSPEALWEEFGFVLRKLGYCRVRLLGPAGPVRTWEPPEAPSDTPVQQGRIHLPHCGGMVMEFWADATLPERVFDVQNELAAEAWGKAMAKWGNGLVMPRPSERTSPPEAARTIAPEVGSRTR
ncbi:MraY family glycosyltransferase [Limisphaera sp. VF-2]|uniref:MraY family glycosyltransferase n=1 Tax=Limisphaera sp. VF-2 TaxID=3400418 RepID=UPI0017575EB3